jgi:hypothetical protein
MPRKHANAKITNSHNPWSQLVILLSTNHLWLAQQASSDVAHIRLLKFVILPIIPVNTHVIEGLDNSIKVEAHNYKPINEILIISLIPTHS